ncbi:MAG TPA: hypothetical protein VMU15_07550 [Anaeromyxobacter sp.]|nr:hypothetical protein [Anaeromyxobacter sp.]
MFRPEPSVTHLPVTRDQVVALVESINQPQVSIPGKPPQAVFGRLCGVRNPNGSLSIYVGLFLPSSGENVVYVHERAQLTVEEYRAVEVEGLHFLESMGFMLDNLNFRNLSPEVQAQTFQRIPLFHPPRPAAPAGSPGAGGASAASVADAGRLGRFLASF